MVLSILEGTNVVFISITFLLITLIGFVILSITLWIEGMHNALVKNLTRGAIIISVGYIFTSIFLIASELYWLGITSQSNFYMMLSLSFYYGGWFLGLRSFMIKTFRLPPERKRKFNIFMNVMTAFVLLLLLLTITTRSLVQKMGENNPIIIGIFIVQGILGIVIYIVFQQMLKDEIEKTASKLMKARFYILRKVILVQLVEFLVVAIGDLLQLIFSEQLLLYEVITISIISLFSLLTIWLLHGIVYVPNVIKERFGIIQTRLENVKRMIMDE